MDNEENRLYLNWYAVIIWVHYNNWISHILGLTSLIVLKWLLLGHLNGQCFTVDKALFQKRGACDACASCFDRMSRGQF